jgi:hypothetical protein
MRIFPAQETGRIGTKNLWVKRTAAGALETLDVSGSNSCLTTRREIVLWGVLNLHTEAIPVLVITCSE